MQVQQQITEMEKELVWDTSASQDLRTIPWFFNLHIATISTGFRLAMKEKLTFRRIFFLFVTCFMWIFCGSVATFFRLLDRIFVKSYSSTVIDKPIFILANPRSGTTFLHRLMSIDPQFETPKMYQTIWPSVLVYKFVHIFQRLGIGMLFTRVFRFFDWYVILCLLNTCFLFYFCVYFILSQDAVRYGQVVLPIYTSPPLFYYYFLASI